MIKLISVDKKLHFKTKLKIGKVNEEGLISRFLNKKNNTFSLFDCLKLITFQVRFATINFSIHEITKNRLSN